MANLKLTDCQKINLCTCFKLEVTFINKKAKNNLGDVIDQKTSAIEQLLKIENKCLV